MKLKTINQCLLVAVVTMTLTGCDDKKKNEVAVEKPVEQAVSLTSKIDNLSYSLGYIIAQRLKNDFNDLDVDVVLKGMKDGLLPDVNPLLPIESMQEIITEDQKIRSEKMKDDLEKEAKENIERSDLFLEDNKKVPGMQTTEAGLQYREIKNPSEEDKKALLSYLDEQPVLTDSMPTDNSQVTVSYVGSYVDKNGNMQEFDSSKTRKKPAEFFLKEVIAGWKEGLKLMKTGQMFEFFIPPKLGYSTQGVPGFIPGNSVLMFKVVLIKTKDFVDPKESNLNRVEADEYEAEAEAEDEDDSE